MADHKLTEASKFLSYVLRHEPQAIGLELDSQGWASVDELVRLATIAGNALDAELVGEIVRTSEKKRFAISEDGSRIRAAQGHSTASVNVEHTEAVPPDVLYHGTAIHHLQSIRKNGLMAGARHYVHLSGDELTARSVAARHGKPVVLIIQSGQMSRSGFTFYRAENGVWLIDRVPPEFLS